MNLLLVGAGGHARPVVETAVDNGHTIVAYAALTDSPWLDVPRLTNDEDLCDSIAGYVMGLGGMSGDTLLHRLSLYRTYAARGLQASTLVHSRAFLAADTEIAAGVTVLAGALVNAGAKIGEAAILNTGAIVEHDARIGCGAHIAPGAILLGAAEIGNCAMVGAGAVILPGAVVPPATLIPSLTRYPH